MRTVLGDSISDETAGNREYRCETDYELPWRAADTPDEMGECGPERKGTHHDTERQATAGDEPSRHCLQRRRVDRGESHANQEAGLDSEGHAVGYQNQCVGHGRSNRAVEHQTTRGHSVGEVECRRQDGADDEADLHCYGQQAGRVRGQVEFVP